MLSMNPLLVVAPHPDDETLACGGLISMATRLRGQVMVLIVSDGSASHQIGDLAKVRAQESRRALAHLGVSAVQFGGLPDGSLGERIHDVVTAVDRSVDVLLAHEPGPAARLDRSTGHRYESTTAEEPHGCGRHPAVLLGPAHGDGHPDHDAVAAACDRVAIARGLRRRHYGVWMWTTERGVNSRHDGAWTFELDEDARRAKNAALDEYTSQLTAMFGTRIVTERLEDWARHHDEVFW